MAKTKTSWVPGQSGNPNGRPPSGHALRDLALEMSDKMQSVKDEKGRERILEVKRILLEKLVSLGVNKDNVYAIKAFLEIAYGKATQPMEFPGGVPVLQGELKPEERDHLAKQMDVFLKPPVKKKPRTRKKK